MASSSDEPKVRSSDKPDRREYKREWQRRWRAANPDKAKMQSKKDWSRRVARSEVPQGRIQLLLRYYEYNVLNASDLGRGA